MVISSPLTSYIILGLCPWIILLALGDQIAMLHAKAAIIIFHVSFLIHITYALILYFQSQMTGTAMLDLPGMTTTSPRLGRTGMLTMSSGYDMTPRSMVCSHHVSYKFYAANIFA